MELFKLCWRLATNNLKSRMEYRAEFIMVPLSTIIGYFSSFCIIWLLTNRFETIQGWNFYEMLLLMNFNLFGYGMAGLFFYGPMINLGRQIQYGRFDSILVRPMNPLLYIVSSQMNSGMSGHIILAIAGLIFSLANLTITWTFAKVMFLLFALFGGTLIHASVLVIAGALSFWTNAPNSFRDVIFETARSFIDYPISIYGEIIQIMLTFVVPFAFINFYPAQYLLSKGTPLFHPILQYGTSVVGVVMCLLAYRLWTAGLNHYESTGS